MARAFVWSWHSRWIFWETLLFFLSSNHAFRSPTHQLLWQHTSIVFETTVHELILLVPRPSLSRLVPVCPTITASGATISVAPAGCGGSLRVCLSPCVPRAPRLVLGLEEEENWVLVWVCPHFGSCRRPRIIATWTRSAVECWMEKVRLIAISTCTRTSGVSIHCGLSFAVDEVLKVDLLLWARCSVVSYVWHFRAIQRRWCFGIYRSEHVSKWIPQNSPNFFISRNKMTYYHLAIHPKNFKKENERIFGKVSYWWGGYGWDGRVNPGEVQSTAVSGDTPVPRMRNPTGWMAWYHQSVVGKEDKLFGTSKSWLSKS